MVLTQRKCYNGGKTMDTENKQKNKEYTDKEGFFSLLNKAINPPKSSLKDLQKSREMDEHSEKKTHSRSVVNSR